MLPGSMRLVKRRIRGHHDVALHEQISERLRIISARHALVVDAYYGGGVRDRIDGDDDLATVEVVDSPPEA